MPATRPALCLSRVWFGVVLWLSLLTAPVSARDLITERAVFEDATRVCIIPELNSDVVIEAVYE